MPTIALEVPLPDTEVQAGLHSANYQDLQVLLNGGLDANNLLGQPSLVAGEAPVWTGTAFARSSVTRIEPTSLKPSSYGTTLPASPYDGQEAILVDSTTVPTYQWRFRWNNSSTNLHKWEFVGGSSAFVIVSTIESTTSTVDVNLATVGPSFTIPRAGVYSIAFGATAGGSGAGNAIVDLYSVVSGTPNFSGIQAVQNVGATVGGFVILQRFYNSFGFSEGNVARLMYSITNGISTSFSQRYLDVRPVRVS